MDKDEEDYGFTGKEKDEETGLMYYGARYYDPVIGRFTSMDPVTLGERSKSLESMLKNPQALNPYSYVLNNPLRYTDPTGKYEEDVHYDLTYTLALVAGLSADIAKTIATSDQYVDENPNTAPMDMSSLSGVWQTAVNFLTGETKKNHFATRENALIRLDKAANEKSVDALGAALHTFQDTYSHSGYVTNHIKDGTKPDKTYNDIAKANEMSKQTFIILRGFNAIINGVGDMSLDEYNTISESQWNNISNTVNSYNTSQDKTSTEITEMAKKTKEKKGLIK